MNRRITQLALLSALAVFVGALAPATVADSLNATPKKAATSTAATTRGTAFRGAVSALDTTAMTLSVTNKSSARVFHVTSETRFFKQDKPATLSDVTLGNAVNGTYRKNGDNLNLIQLRITPPVEPKKAAPKKGAAAETKPAK